MWQQVQYTYRFYIHKWLNTLDRWTLPSSSLCSTWENQRKDAEGQGFHFSCKLKCEIENKLEHIDLKRKDHTCYLFRPYPLSNILYPLYFFVVHTADTILYVKIVWAFGLLLHVARRTYARATHCIQVCDWRKTCFCSRPPITRICPWQSILTQSILYPVPCKHQVMERVKYKMCDKTEKEYT